MAGYPYLSQVQDPAAQKAIKALADQLNGLINRIVALESATLRNTTTLNANGQRLTGLGSPQLESDAVTLAYLRAYVQSQVETF